MARQSNIPVNVTIDSAPIQAISETFATISNKYGESFKEMTERLRQVTDTLNKLGITVFTPEGEYRHLGDVLEEAYNKERTDLLRPETPEETEISNENMSFDFLNQNAYDKIKPIFKEENYDAITPLDLY